VNRAALIAAADRADQEADAIFAKMHAASLAQPADHRGRRMIPAGWEARAQEASDLRRHAEALRLDAAEVPAPAVSSSASPALTPPPSPTICPAAAATPSPVEVDPIEAAVARIMSA
jgi:hypothetical protein